MLAIISDLGLAMPPANSVDREAHAARIMLLAQDCADLPVEHLRTAAEEWRRTKPFLPRACELRDLAIAHCRIDSRDRLLAPPRASARPAREQPPLTDAEVAALPTRLLSMAVKLGEVSQDRADRILSERQSAHQ